MTPIVLTKFYSLADTEAGGAPIHVDKKQLVRHLINGLPRGLKVELFTGLEISLTNTLKQRYQDHT